MGLRLSVIAVCSVTIIAGAAATFAAAGNASSKAALCQGGKGYWGHSSSSSPSYNYNATIPGARTHVASSPRIPRVLLPVVSFSRRPLVTIRFDYFGSDWRVELHYREGCTASGGSTDNTAGALHWGVTTLSRLYPRSCQNCVVSTRRIRGITVTRQGLKAYGKVFEYQFVFSIGKLTYNVRGHQPFTVQAPEDQGGWLETFIRRAQYAGR